MREIVFGKHYSSVDLSDWLAWYANSCYKFEVGINE